MGIGTIGAVSASSSFQPAGSAELVTSLKVKGFEKFSLSAGNYVVHADQEMAFFDNGKFLGYIEKNGSGAISLSASSSNVTAEACSINWERVDTGGGTSVPASSLYSYRPYSFSTDGQTVCELHTNSNLYVSTDGGETYGSAIGYNTVWPNGNSSGYHACSPAVAPNGTIYVAPYAPQGGSNRVSFSTDNGATWGTIGRPDASYDYGAAVGRVGDKIVVVYSYNSNQSQSMIAIFDPSVSTSTPQHYFYVTGIHPSGFNFSSASYYMGIAPIPGSNRARVLWYDNTSSTSYTYRYYDLNLDSMPSNASSGGYTGSTYGIDSQPQQNAYYFGEPEKQKVFFPYHTQATYAAGYVGSAYLDGTGAHWTYWAHYSHQGEGSYSTAYSSTNSAFGLNNAFVPTSRTNVRAGDTANVSTFYATTFIFDQYTNSAANMYSINRDVNTHRISPEPKEGSSSYRAKKLPSGDYILPGRNFKAKPASVYIYSEVA